MAGASIETTLELWASSLRDVKARMRPLFAQSCGGVGELVPGRPAERGAAQDRLDASGSGRRPRAVPIRKSVTPDYIISLEDGRSFKSLTRHLKNSYRFAPDEYRTKWGLPRPLHPARRAL